MKTFMIGVNRDNIFESNDVLKSIAKKSVHLLGTFTLLILSCDITGACIFAMLFQSMKRDII